jgi:hypothetical protein
LCSPAPGASRVLPWLLWILLAIVVLLVVVLVLFYNRLVRLRNRVENAWAQVDVQLKRRYDLIPNLVETVKGLRLARARDVRGRDRCAHPRGGSSGAGGAGRR